MGALRHSKSGRLSVMLIVLVFIAAGRADAQPAWKVYKPDAKFSDTFGRTVTIRSESEGRTRQIDDPTLQQALQVKGDAPVNVLARESVTALLASVASGTAKACADLTSLKLPWVRVLSGEDTAASGDLPAYCKVLGTVDKEIGFEVDLPAAAQWNGKFLMGGSGGFLGDLENGVKTVALDRGYATAVTDAGHRPNKDNPLGADWAFRDPERLLNFGHRGTHLSAATAKLVVQAFYGKALSHAYFSGTSGSGRQAMMELQRYPGDFDGIIAGCPGFNQTRMRLGAAWAQQAMYPTAEDQYNFRPLVPPGKVPLLDAAVMTKCDAVDGLKDGLIADPRMCHFDPMADLPRCAAGEDKPNCFTAEQANVIARIHAGPSNSAGQIWPGWVYGGEGTPGQWVSPTGGNAYVIGGPKAQDPYSSRHYMLSNETFRYFIYSDPSYDLHRFNFETDVPATFPVSQVVDANDPDLTPFKSRGKLIMWQGWNDWATNGSSAVEYFERVLKKMGGTPQVDTFARMFMLPGVGHCAAVPPGQRTPNVVDFLTALEQWVERGVAPDRIVASHVASGPAPQFSMPIKGPVDRTRPLCPYPQMAAYKGTGNIDEAASFVCRAPRAPTGPTATGARARDAN